MYEIAVVEDDANFVAQLEGFLKQFEDEFQEEFHVTVFSDGEEIVKNYRSQFDLILMDIEMAHMDGMTAAEKIRERDQKVVIIFITNMSQYAIRGYEVEALDYIVKPVSYTAFSLRLERALSRMQKRAEHYITITEKDGIWTVPTDDVYWIESFGHRLTYVTRTGNHESTRNSLKEIEESLREDHFYRCNNSYLVNLAHVKGIKDGCAVVNGSLLQISRSKKQGFMQALAEYAGDVIK